jgi:hypothetical protein
MTTAASRHAQYSAIAPSLVKQVGSQYPRYSVTLRVSSDQRGWKAVSLVMTGSASGVTRCAMAIEKRFSGA